jgi:hypothetical protein
LVNAPPPTPISFTVLVKKGQQAKLPVLKCVNPHLIKVIERIAQQQILKWFPQCITQKLLKVALIHFAEQSINS